MMENLVSKLDLTPEQQAKIKPIVDQANDELRQLRRTTQRTTVGVLERMQADISAQLTPEQKAKFDSQMGHQRERFRHFMEERAKRMRERGQPPPPDGSKP